MANTKKAQRAMLITMALLFTMVQFAFSAYQVYAFSAGQSCTSSYGRELSGYDGKPYYNFQSEWYMLKYESNGNSSFVKRDPTTKPHKFFTIKSGNNSTWAYCIENGVTFYEGNDGYTSQSHTNNNYFQNLPAIARWGIMAASLYGWQPGCSLPISGINTDDFWFATQVIMWEFQQGIRTSVSGGRSNNGPINKDQIYNQLKGRPAEKAYDWILDKISKHNVVPSYTNVDSWETPQHVMKYDKALGAYTLTLTDKNALGVDLKVLSGGSGITITRSGNNYTFTSKKAITNAVTLKFQKDLPQNPGDFMIWGKGGNQTMSTGAEDPVQFYMGLKTEPFGEIELFKEAEDGVSLAGWEFKVSGRNIDTTVKTDSKGKISIPNLVAGTVEITEVNVPDYFEQPATQKINVIANQVNKVYFSNKMKRGNLEIQKVSEDGLFIKNIGFRVTGTPHAGTAWKYDKVHYTDKSGRIYISDLLIGTYKVEEVSETVNSNYYVASSESISVKWNNKASVSPYNKLKRVPLKIIKESYNGKNLAGIQFLVKGVTGSGSEWEHIYTTNSKGIIDVAENDADAPPIGTYAITELESDINIGYILPTGKNETFTYGDKVELYFYNAPKMGSLKVTKTDDLGNKFVEGIEFSLTGTSYSGDSVNLKAVTDKDGIAEFIEVPIGIYELREENTPIFFVTLDADDVEVIYAQTNEHDVENIAKRTDLQIIKTSTDMENIEGIPFRVIGLPLAGTEFAYDEIHYTDSNGRIYISDLLVGNYSVVEMESDKTIGYVTPDSQDVILEYGTKGELEFFNKRIENNIKVVKFDGFNNLPLEGVLFGLFDEAGNQVTAGRTDKNGELAFECIYYGKYKLIELEGLIGYYVLDPIDIEVVMDGQEQVFELHNERIPCEIQIYKTDGTDKLPVEGAVFGLYDEECNLIEQAVTDYNGYLEFSPQIWGLTVFIKEISAPVGYLINETIEEFEIKAGDLAKGFEFVNERSTCDIKVIKTDGTSTEPLEGVRFGLYDEDGLLMQFADTDKNGELTFENLLWGFTYTVYELEALQGYIENITPYQITINRTDKLIELQAVNERAPVSIVLYKVDEKGKALAGAEFELLDAGGTVLSSGVSDEKGNIEFSAIWGQVVFVREKTAPAGYQINTGIYELELVREQETMELTVANIPREEVPTTGDAFPLLFVLFPAIAGFAAALVLFIRNKRRKIETINKKDLHK